MANYQSTAKKKDKKGKGLGVMSNSDLKKLLEKEGFIKSDHNSR